ncbi:MULTISPECIES: 4'-phosphopantetheinyl transferase superfamily protein [unclassified Brenneria]|uniref:4'-phosphopantetheinyl transferase family protein n=1 Tax=unclassified Brenneria TaxID=2634434 RepID=UPI0029C21603|nr:MULTISPECIES: 4'-phosphopantetheinyl transferase superfamily protein [unclassified Brenneria]MDX5628435.1 4'-phosphopantetheinyl transferase superfamily protein [Brenneria sp. L3-3Z]MDX5695382.1 4'-phosphopantetheinyl transferase superfamily protein [Brenneria sp. L4-2C]MEE3662221.1 4'-phosphopantetheinyl transferase superfamily protein [Brenneria sp. g21c3]
MLAAFIDDVEWISFPQAKDGAMYPGFVARGHFHLSAYSDDLFAEAEVPFSDALARSVPKRRAEFLAGRCLAKQVLSKLGYADFVLNCAEDRSPLWPENVSGSLSHNTHSILCAAHIRTPEFSGVGVDIETFMSAKRAESLWPGIVGEDEYHWLHARDDEFRCLLTLNFSAKESLFKALYPQVKHYFDFLDVGMVALDSASQSFELELLTDLSPAFCAGRRFKGAYLQRTDDITTFLCC